MGNLFTLRRGRCTRIPKAQAHTRSDNAVELRQQTVRTLGQILRPKLSVGAPDDAQEREADALAERVMRLPESGDNPGEERLQPACPACRDDEERVRRVSKPEEDEEEDKELRTKATGTDGLVGPVATDTASRIQARRGAGMPLPPSERAFFEPRFGADFSRVRLHADPQAAELSRRLAARAFAVGRDLFFGPGEYEPATAAGRRLLAHELAHVQQQDRTGQAIWRWTTGAAPAPHGWSEVTDADQLRRLGEAEDIVRGVVGNRNCQNYFRDNCTNGAGANALRNVFDNANIYLRAVDDNMFGEGEPGGRNIAFNLRAYRIGRFMMASTLLHEMFHTCDPTAAGNAAELSAETAVETCRLHTPLIDSVSPRRGPVGAQVTIRGWNFGPTQGATDRVRIGGVLAPVQSWTFMSGTTSRVEIQVAVPAGATSGDLGVVNNNIVSNPAAFTVT